MTHAYQEIYLSNAQALLGDAFDYAINACGVAGDSFIKLFSVSSVSNRIENGEPSYLLGKSGIETAVDVLRALRAPDTKFCPSWELQLRYDQYGVSLPYSCLCICFW